MNKERLTAYLRSLESFPDEDLNLLRDQAEADRVPIIRPETESFLRTILKITAPSRILEIGTAVGYSAIVMAKASAAVIDTIENYEKRIPVAKANIEAAGYLNRITLIEGDAGEVLRKKAEETAAEGLYDFVFLDAAKGQYLNWLPDILKLMHPGSVLVTDNVLQDETVIESRFAIPRRERTTHQRMRDFLYELKHHPQLETSVLPVGDGVSLSIYIDP